MAQPVALRTDEPVDPGVLPGWFYVVLSLWLVVLIIFPFSAVRFALLGCFWLLYFSFYFIAPERLMVMFIIGLPAMVLAPPGFKIAPLVNNYTVFIGTLIAAAMIVKGRESDPPPNRPLGTPVLFYVTLLTLSAVMANLTGSAQVHSWETGWSPMPARSLFTQLKNIAIFALLAPIAFRLVWRKEHLRQVLYVIALVTTLLCLHNIWLLREPILTGQIGPWFRAEGLHFKEPNSFGGYLALMLTIFISMLIGGKLSRGERWLFVTATVFGGATLLFTLSRGSWLALMAALLLIAFTRGARAFILLLVLGLSAVFWIPESVIERAKMTIRDKDPGFSRPFMEEGLEIEGSAGSRIEHWKKMPEQLIRSPIWGHGFRSYGGVNQQLTRRGTARSAHSTIIEMTVEEGLLGLGAYIWLVAALAMGARSVQRLSDDPFFVALAAGFFAALFCLVVLDASGARLSMPGVMAYMWILGGGLARMAWGLEQKHRQKRIAEQELRRRNYRRRSPKSRTGPPLEPAPSRG